MNGSREYVNESWEQYAVGKNYYHILGVSSDASAEDIKAAFRREARNCHPDTHPGDKAAEERFKLINEAHQILSDEKKRRRYDELRKGRQQAQQAYSSSNQPEQSFSGSWSDFFTGWGFTNKTQEARAPESRALQELENTLLKTQSIDQLLAEMKKWLQNAKGIDVNATYPFGYTVSARSLYLLLEKYQTDKEAHDAVDSFLDLVTRLSPNALASHIKQVIGRASVKSEPQPQQYRTNEKPETHHSSNLTTEKEQQAIETLLTNLMGVDTLEDTIKTLQNWINLNKTLEGSKVSAFSSFSPAELLAELQAFTSGRLTKLEQSQLLKGFSALAVGMGRLVTAYLEKKTTVNEAAETVMPVDKDRTGSDEINKLRDALIATNNLAEALAVLNTSTVSETITHFPSCARNVLANTLNLIVEVKKFQWHEVKFFKEAQAARRNGAISTVADHLLTLAETGKIQKS